MNDHNILIFLFYLLLLLLQIPQNIEDFRQK